MKVYSVIATAGDYEAWHARTVITYTRRSSAEAHVKRAEAYASEHGLCTRWSGDWDDFENLHAANPFDPCEFIPSGASSTGVEYSVREIVVTEGGIAAGLAKLAPRVVPIPPPPPGCTECDPDTGVHVYFGDCVHA